jgi:hypothetical protein
MTLMILPCFAYSERKSAAPIPIGIARIKPTTISITVFNTKGKIPKLPVKNDGSDVRKLQFITGKPFTKM